MRKNIIVSSLVSILLLAMLVGAWMYWSHQQLAAVQQLQASVFSKEARDLPDDQRRQKMEDYRAQYNRLTESQQRRLRADMRAGGQQRMYRPINEYFALPQAKRNAFLDQQINESEKRRKSRRNGSATGRGRGGPGAGRGGAERGRGGAKLTESQKSDFRDRMRRGRLDNTTAKQRAEMSEYFAALKQRREKRGLPSRGPRGV